VLVHWILALHRIRMDAANPLAWDIGWLAVFGIVPLLAGLWLARRNGAQMNLHRGSVALLAAAVGLAGGFAVQSPRAPQGMSESAVLIVLPGHTAADAIAAAGDMQASLLWSDRAGKVWVVATARPQRALLQIRNGALVIHDAGFSAGCISSRRI
jgi:hypothetical protein